MRPWLAPLAATVIGVVLVCLLPASLFQPAGLPTVPVPGAPVEGLSPDPGAAASAPRAADAVAETPGAAAAPAAVDAEAGLPPIRANPQTDRIKRRSLIIGIELSRPADGPLVVLVKPRRDVTACAVTVAVEGGVTIADDTGEAARALGDLEAGSSTTMAIPITITGERGKVMVRVRATADGKVIGNGSTWGFGGPPPRNEELEGRIDTERNEVILPAGPAPTQP